MTVLYAKLCFFFRAKELVNQKREEKARKETDEVKKKEKERRELGKEMGKLKGLEQFQLISWYYPAMLHPIQDFRACKKI